MTAGVRKLIVRKYPYLTYYEVNEDVSEVVVLPIQHSARDRVHDDT